jgi:hypothetical protein
MVLLQQGGRWMGRMGVLAVTGLAEVGGGWLPLFGVLNCQVCNGLQMAVNGRCWNGALLVSARL